MAENQKEIEKGYTDLHPNSKIPALRKENEIQFIKNNMIDLIPIAKKIKEEELNKEIKKCIVCNRRLKLRKDNKTKLCSNCRSSNLYKQKYEELLREFERHKIICNKIQLDYFNKLKKYEQIDWEGN